MPAPTPAAPPADPLNDLYRNLLGRDIDEGGRSYWNQDLARGASINQVAANIALSPEATVTRLYRSILGRDPDEGGRAYWRDELTRGVTSAADLERILREAKAQGG